MLHCNHCGKFFASESMFADHAFKEEHAPLRVVFEDYKRRILYSNRRRGVFDAIFRETLAHMSQDEIESIQTYIENKYAPFREYLYSPFIELYPVELEEMYPCYDNVELILRYIANCFRGEAADELKPEFEKLQKNFYESRKNEFPTATFISYKDVDRIIYECDDMILKLIYLIYNFHWQVVNEEEVQLNCNCVVDWKSLNSFVVFPLNKDLTFPVPSNLIGTCHEHKLLYGTPMVELHRKADAESAHYLRAYMGKCRALHGHRYEIDLALKLPISPVLEMALDYGYIKEALKFAIDRYFDHMNLTEVFSFNTTTEMLLLALWEILEKARSIKGLSRLSIAETANSYAVVTLNDMANNPIYLTKTVVEIITMYRYIMKYKNGSETWLNDLFKR